MIVITMITKMMKTTMMMVIKLYRYFNYVTIVYCLFGPFEDVSSGYESDPENATTERGLPLVSTLAEHSMLVHGPPHRRRRDRTQFSVSDLRRLEGVFVVDRYPDIILRNQLASDLAVSEDRIQVCMYSQGLFFH